MSNETTAVATRNQEQAKKAWGLLQSMKPSIQNILPKHLTPERMAMIAFTAMRQNPKLMECSKESIIGSIMTASILGLEPSGPLGHGALIPYKGECQFQPMYQGLLELARRSGIIKDVQLRAVYKGDHYKYRFGLDPMIEHVPMEGEGADDPSRPVTHVYAIVRFMSGGVQWDQASYADMIAHGLRFSKSREGKSFKAGSPWAEHPVAMAQKTILKRVLKLCPKSPEMAQAMALDDFNEAGKTATLTKMADGVFDVEFGGSEETQTEGPKTGAVLDNLVKSAAKKTEPPDVPAGDDAAEIEEDQYTVLYDMMTEAGLKFGDVQEFLKTIGYEKPKMRSIKASDYKAVYEWLDGKKLKG